MEMLENLTYEVTDEKTMLQEKLDEARAQKSLTERELEAVKRDLSAANARISQLMELDKENHALIDMMTEASNRKGKDLQREQAWHDQELIRLAKRAEKRETMNAVAGFVAGLASTALIVSIVMLVWLGCGKWSMTPTSPAATVRRNHSGSSSKRPATC